MKSFARLAYSISSALVCFSASGVYAASSQMTVPMLADKPVIDGRVSAEEQKNAVSVNLQKIASLDPPKIATKVYVAATMQGLYVGFICDEPNLNTMVANVTTTNGAVFQDDSVQVLITPSIETAADDYYHFAVNSAGVSYSSHIIAREPVTGWQVAVSKEPGSDKDQPGHWEAEFFIPLKSMDAPQELPTWRGNFARYRPARGNQPEEMTAWVDPGISIHNYKKFGYLTMPRFVPAPPGGSAVTTDSEAAENTPAPSESSAETGQAIDTHTTMPVSRAVNFVK